MTKHPTADPIEHLSPEELDVHQAPLLARQLAYVATHSPLYQEIYRAAGLSPADAAQPQNLRHLPFSDKRTILADQEAFPPFGRLATGGGRDPLLRVHTTSGTTGTPFCIVLTDADAEGTRVAGRRAFRCAGLTPAHTVVHCLNYCLWAGGLTDHLSLEATGALVIPFGVGHTRKLLDTILQLGANAISCTPSYLARLEVVLREELHREPRELGLRLALCGGEGGLQSPAVRRRIEDLWGLRAVDANYGMADVLSIFGAECEERAGLHFHGQELLHVELIDPNAPTDPGASPLPLRRGQVGEVVLTNLQRQAQPLVRYRTGDLWEITGTERCGCGRGSLRFVAVGRSDQMLTVRGVNLYPGALASLLGERSESFSGEFEILVDHPAPLDHVTLRVELSPGVAATPALEAAFLTLCRQRLTLTPRLHLLPFGDFPRTEGKTRRVRHVSAAEVAALTEGRGS